jgi:hypothetical protein
MLAFWLIATIWIGIALQRTLLAIQVLASGGILLVMVVFSFYWLDRQEKQLTAVVRETLGDPTFYQELG